MSGLMNHIIRLALSMSLMDRELFINKTAEIMQLYKDDPAQMEKIARGLYQYLEEVKNRMDTKSMLNDVVDYAKIPSKDEINELTNAIHSLAKEIKNQHKEKA